MKLVKAKYPYCPKACEMLGIYNDTVVNTICENIAGHMWVDDENNPKVVLGKYKSYHYLNGNPQEIENLTDILFDRCNHPVLIANNNSWVEFLDANVNAKHTERYRLLTPQKFDEETLKGYFERINNLGKNVLSDVPSDTSKVVGSINHSVEVYNPHGSQTKRTE